MMRRASTVLVSVATIVAALALPAPGGAAAPMRHATLTLNPAPGDVELAELEFKGRGRHSISLTTLQVAARGRFGADYLAVATPRRRPRGELVALVLLVNRPTALADPVAVRVSVRSARALGRTFPLKLRDPLTGPYKLPVVAGNVAPDLPCHVPRTGSSLGARDLRQVGPARGAALSGFSAPAAVAAAYDAGCGLPYPSAFRQAVKGSGPPGCAPGAAQQGTLCCPPNAMCAPGPTPQPVPPGPAPPGSPPPRCQPCNPRPGYACPLLAQPAICPAVAPAAKRVAPAAPH